MTSDAVSAAIDRIILTDLVARLARAVDRGDRGGIASCYATESFDDHGGFRGDGAAFADFIVDSEFATASPFVFHLLGQSIWDIEGDEAFGETSFDFSMSLESDRLFRRLGRYLDYCVREHGEWKIRYRRVVIDYRGSVSAEHEPIRKGPLEGRRGDSDPSLRRLRWPPNHSSSYDQGN